MSEGSEAARSNGQVIAERRVASILFADLVGFTPFAEQLDPEEVRDVLSGYFDRCRELIGRYGGTVEKFIGDAVMAVWGAPSAHEDDAERAVRAGLDLVEAIAAYGAGIGADALQVRVGIATGEVAVTVGAIGEGLVSGDVVNTASRVQARGTPGEVWVDGQTMQLTSAAIQYADQGEHELKGKSAPIPLFAARTVVSSVGGGRPVDQLTIPLAGYRRELALVKELFHAAVEESKGRLLLVAGEPGVGKTRLGHELGNYLDGFSTVVRWYWGQCLSYGEGIVYSALVHAVRGRIDASEADDPATIRAKLSSSFDEFAVDRSERDWLAPRIEALLGLTTETYAREDLFAAWLRWFEIIGSDGSPVVWVVDDGQYADDALLDFIEHLVRSSGIPLFVLMLARPELLDRRPRFGSGRRTSYLNLEGLHRQAMEDLVDALVGNLPAVERRALIKQADGIPLYAIETVRTMMDRGEVIQAAPGRRERANGNATSPVSSETPASLQVLVSSRLDMLGDDERALLQDAAVLGQSFSRDDVQGLTGLDDDDLDQRLDRLQHRDLLGKVVDRFSPFDGQYMFVQSIVRQVAYDRLARRSRIDRHVRAANYLMDLDVSGDRAAIVAQHLTDAIALTAGSDPLRVALADQRASWLERAADRARSVGAHGDALRLYTLALEHVEETDARLRLQLRAAEAAYAVGNFARAVAHSRAISTSDPTQTAWATVIEYRALRDTGLGSEALVALQRYPTPEALAGIAPVVASEIAYRWVTAMYNGFIAGDSREWAEAAYVWAVRAEDPLALAMALNGYFLANINMPEYVLMARLVMDEMIRISREHRLSNALGIGLANRANIEGGRDLALCLRNFREVVEIRRQSGGADWSYVSETNLCHALWLAGEWDECLRVEADRPQPEGDIAVIEFNVPKIPVTLIAYARGMTLDPPAEWLALESQPPPSPPIASARLLLIGLAKRQAGDLDAAATLAREAVRGAYDASHLMDEFHYFWSPAVDWSLAAGHVAEARALCDLIDQEPAQFVSPYLRAALAAWRGTINASDPHSTASPAAIEADLRAGIAGFDAFGAVPDRARTQATLGTWLLDQDRPDDARELLQAAASTFRDLGAERWLAALPEGFRELSGS